MSTLHIESFATYSEPEDLLISGSEYVGVNNPQNIAILPNGSSESRAAIRFSYDGSRVSTNEGYGSSYSYRYGEVAFGWTSSPLTVVMGFILTIDEETSSTMLGICDIGDGTIDDANFTLRIDNQNRLSISLQTSSAYAGWIGMIEDNYSDPLVTGQAYHIEVKVLVHGTAGTIAFKINGNKVFDYTGDTSNGSLYHKRASLGAHQFNTSGTPIDGTYTISDWYVINADDAVEPFDWIGPLARVEYLPVDAETATIGFTPSTGTDNAAMLSETGFHDFDTTRNTGGAVSDKDLFTVAALSEPTKGEVLAIKPIMVASKDNTDARTVDLIYAHNSVEASDTKTMTQTYDQFSIISALNPDTSAAWLKSQIPTLEVGYENMT